MNDTSRRPWGLAGWIAGHVVVIAVAVSLVVFGFLATRPEPQAMANAPAAPVSAVSTLPVTTVTVATAPAATVATNIAAREALLTPSLADRRTIVTRVRRGDTLAGVVNDAGARASDAGQAVAALRGVFDARDLQAGVSVVVFLADVNETPELMGFGFAPDAERTYQVVRDGVGGFRTLVLDTPLNHRLTVAAGTIETSLYVDAINAGANAQVVADIAGLLAYSVDFQREIHPGDPFEILFEEWVTPDGETVRTGEVHFIEFAPQGRRLAYWRFETEDGRVGFYDANGESAKRFLMKTPIDGARLSSHFGRRRHPISGYTRMHKGTDFAAPTGTPIYAAGDGVVERANRFGTFGYYVRIRHANGYHTAYAHLSRFARGVRAGVRVRQGQTIGYVGSTGASTGPHLHYEVIHNGEHINPMTMRAPTGRTLTETEKTTFAAAQDGLNAMRLQAYRPAGSIDADAPSHALAAHEAGGPDAPVRGGD